MQQIIDIDRRCRYEAKLRSTADDMTSQGTTDCVLAADDCLDHFCVENWCQNVTDASSPEGMDAFSPLQV